MLWRPAPSPVVEVSLLPSTVGQGKTLILWVSSSGPFKEIKGHLGERELSFFPLEVAEKKLHRSVVGIPMDMNPGEHELEIRFTDFRGRSGTHREVLKVLETEFVEEEIAIPSEKSSFLTSKYLPEEARSIREAMQETEEERLWSGPFIMPLEGRLSSPFGARRVYNQGTMAGRHRGVDIASKEGVGVLAPNSGRVVLSETMMVHGETVILDHGQGVFSIFNHLRERFVEVGENVGKGEMTGSLGETGLATGPHLHWGLYVGGVCVDPLEWTERAMDQLPLEEVPAGGM